MMEEKRAREKEKIEKSKSNTNKSNTKKIIFASILVLIIIAIALVLIFSGKKTSNSITQGVKSTKFIVSYAIYADGNLYENKENMSIIDGKISEKLGLISNKLDDYLKNAEIGTSFNVSLNANEAYGDYNENLRKVLQRTLKESRYTELQLYINLSKQDFVKYFGQEPIVNQTYNVGTPFPLKVVSVGNNVTLTYDIKIGSKTEKNALGFWFEVVEINENEKKFKVKLNGDSVEIPVENAMINISFDNENILYTIIPQLGKEVEWSGVRGRVVEFNETNLVIDNNHPLAGKNIDVFVKVLDKEVEENIITGSCILHANAPTMDVFIMSYCPYGLQFVKGLLPVWKEFNDKANINVRFVSYTMHGQKEEEENKRMACIREEQCDKYMAYLECFVADGNANSCIEKLGIDKAKLEDCMANRAKNYLDYDAQLNEKYGVRGSPTVVINGKQVEIWPRSPANIAKKLCEYFSEKPEECSLSFSNENPSPGFGYSASSSNQQASCG